MFPFWISMYSKQTLIVVIIALSLLFVMIGNAAAKVPMQSLAEHIESSKLIIVGTVRSIENDTLDSDEAKAVIAVETVLLGTPSATVDVYFEPSLPSVSAYFEVQQRCVFFLSLWEGKWKVHGAYGGEVCESTDGVVKSIYMIDQPSGQKMDDFILKIRRYLKRAHEKIEDDPLKEGRPAKILKKGLVEHVGSSKLIIIGTVRSIEDAISGNNEAKASIAVETVLLGMPSATVDIHFKPSLPYSPSFKAQERCVFFLQLWEGKWIINDVYTGKVCESAGNVLKPIDMLDEKSEQKTDDFIAKIRLFLEKIYGKVRAVP